MSPYPKSIIDSVISLLQKAKEELGGDYFIQTYESHGERIDIENFSVSSVLRGSACWETMFLT